MIFSQQRKKLENQQKSNAKHSIYKQNCKSKTKIKEEGIKEYCVDVSYSEIHRNNNKNRKRMKKKRGKEIKHIDNCMR